MSTLQLNYFSLLIPLFLSVVACILIIWGRFQRLPDYMPWLTSGIVFAVGVQLVQTLVPPAETYNWALLNYFFYFISIFSTVQAVYIRFKIATRWTHVLSYFLTAQVLIAYFSLVQPSLDAILSIVAIASVLICFNRPLALLKHRSAHFLDRLLKICFYAMTLTVIVRSAYLVYAYDEMIWVQQQDLIWALTQFIILFFTMAMISICISCTLTDTFERLYRERSLDPLTGLLNRRALNERLSGFLARKSIYQHAILLCDIDYFKKINDRYGHYVGDLALQHVAQLLNQYLRKYDEVARIGGEEFQILLLDVPRDTAICVAERIRLSVAHTPLEYENQKIDLSLSIGVAYFQNAQDYTTALEDADTLLYQAKKFGRNNIQWQYLSEPAPEQIHHIMHKLQFLRS